jgi:hypothetical protein
VDLEPASIFPLVIDAPFLGIPRASGLCCRACVGVEPMYIAGTGKKHIYVVCTVSRRGFSPWCGQCPPTRAIPTPTPDLSSPSIKRAASKLEVAVARPSTNGGGAVGLTWRASGEPSSS